MRVMIKNKYRALKWGILKRLFPKYCKRKYDKAMREIIGKVFR